MSKITLDNLSDNLKAYLEGLGLSEEQVLNLINENGLDEEELKAMLKDTMSINELNTSSKTVIGAINELFQSANNGKQLIASAIGEPVSADDTFSAMSNDINSLLSTFKTNMMNNGVTVESGDKFKSLIDKIATMVEEGEGKGIQFAEGTATMTITASSGWTQFSFIDIDFDPTLVILRTYSTTYDLPSVYNIIDSSIHNSESNHGILSSGYDWTPGCYINGKNVFAANSASYDCSYNVKYYAIGVGEEDTTLRDSLASILEEEGVTVTEEDDMASLISKVDEEFDRKNANSGLDIISATELPATGKENQICVITDNPVDKFFVTNFNSDIPEGYDGIALVLSTTATDNPIETATGTQTLKLHFLTTLQNNNSKTSYVFKNGSWQVLTKGVVLMITNTGLFNTDIFGYFDSRGGGVNVEWQDNYGYYFYCNGDYSGAYLKNNKPIDFSKYNKITYTISNPYNETSYFGSRDHFLVLIDTSTSQLELTSRSHFSANGTYTVDISNVYATGYIQIYVGNYDNGSMSWFNVSYLAIE